MLGWLGQLASPRLRFWAEVKISGRTEEVSGAWRSETGAQEGSKLRLTIILTSSEPMVEALVLIVSSSYS
jgi:hypothetical protein